eukprot:CAMPEP_0173387522 /NCGR_PEP_ID=MMETSP1356-20130122/10016_1 /TAXON_ID=77927 ORGANISM="Hemiselmis virescens, Strain PCC157" /NCGR_SAMPLE_ID=MMETSP1356 /ASSEMBLY_ACC=CAM_ASM_000847 /LENGTH=66 /DNA_ID=CAMNT_0014344169 /DNA_START=189 /DNA_END=389 /DNA_ORIENTATION=+
MEHPVERDEKCRKWLLVVQEGANDRKERLKMPTKAPYFWRPFASTPEPLMQAKMADPYRPATSGVY